VLLPLGLFTAREVLRTLYHEAYHAYEHRLVDQYNALRPEEQKLRLYARAAQYAAEFQNYQDGSEDFARYQCMARSARSHCTIRDKILKEGLFSAVL